MTSSSGDEDIQRIQRELAGLWIQNGALQISLWDSDPSEVDWEVPEIPSLEDLGVVPKINVETAFADYLEKFGEIAIESPSKTLLDLPVKSSLRGQEALRILPESFCSDPSAFCLTENWDFLFEHTSSSLWEQRAHYLHGLKECIEDDLFQHALNARETFRGCLGGLMYLRDHVSKLANQIKTHRACLARESNCFVDYCSAVLLKRKKRNLEEVLGTLSQISEIDEAVQDMETLLNDPDATDLIYRDVLIAFQDVQSKVREMNGRYLILEALVLDQFGETIVQKRRSRIEQVLNETYEYDREMLRTSMRHEKWGYVVDDSRLSTIAEKLGDLTNMGSSEIHTTEGRIRYHSREYGIVGSLEPLLVTMLHLKHNSLDSTALAVSAANFALEGFRVFNSMTSQLILGAGAIHSAGLKSITVKHLAIAYEQICLVSIVASTIGRILVSGIDGDENPGQIEFLTEEFELCVKEMEIHTVEIKVKLTRVACDLMIPLMKDASMALSAAADDSRRFSDDGLLPFFKELIGQLCQKYSTFANLIRGSLGDKEVDEVLESICEDLVTWLRDGSRFFRKDTYHVYMTHVRYCEESFRSIYSSDFFNSLLSDIESQTLQE
jgi:hypothetical protein